MSPESSPLIAVIDDDSVYQFTASRTLKATHLPHQILQFQNGQEALSFLRGSAETNQPLPDIIFLDINMPITDGWAFLDEFHKLKARLAKDIKIYMVSSSIDPRDQNRAKSIPEVTDYIEKPISMNQFSEVLLNWGKETKK
ncbi:MAG: response regulator [Cyclobacteriaceae bacterium]|nr:response regulator [Cyclobacteriaceae bacterium]